MDMLDFGLPQLPGQKKGFEFRDILSAGWRRKWLLIIPFIACFVGGLLICAFWEKKYTADAVLQLPRRPTAEEEQSAQAFRYHQTKFMEHAEALRLRVTNRETLKEKLLEVPNLVDPDRSPSLSYRIKVWFFGLEKDPGGKPGLTEQIEDIISNIRIEISESNPIVRISYSGTSRANAVDVCSLIVGMFKQEDQVRRKALEEEYDTRQKARKELENSLADAERKLYYQRNDATVVQPDYEPYLRETLRNYRSDLRQVSSSYADLNSRLEVSLAQWKTTARILPPPDVQKQGVQEEEKETLKSDELARLDEVIATMEKTYPKGHPDLEKAKVYRKQLLRDVQVESKRIAEMSYMLPFLEKRQSELTVQYNAINEKLKEIRDSIAKLEAEGKGADPTEKKAQQEQLQVKTNEHDSVFGDLSKTTADLAEYRKLQRLVSAKTGPTVVKATEPESTTPSPEGATPAAAGEIPVKSLQKELDAAIAAPPTERINPEWIVNLAEVISIYNASESNKGQIKDLNTEIQYVEGDIKKAQDSANKVKDMERQRDDLAKKFDEEDRRFRVADESYRAFTGQYGERLVDLVPPSPPLTFSSPNFRIVLAVAALAGLAIGGLLVVLGEITDHTLKRPQELKAYVKQPILAAIPSLELAAGVRGNPQSLFYRTKREVERDLERGALFDRDYLRDIRFRNIATEQMRKFRISMLESGAAGARPRTILITSALAGEGKSTVAANLALAISQMIGEHVLLVDCDLRRPDLHNFFDLPPKPGLAEYLSEDIDLADLLVKTGFDKLTLLQAGKVPANSTELLHSDRMRNLIKELKSRYTDRYIIIDSPPLMSTSEPDVLAEQVDGVVLVVRAGMTPRELVEDVLAQINHDKVLGVVMNDVKTGISKYYAPSYSA